ncbi:MAG: hypothetical protein NVS3B28_27980 [Candidatus Velthaea sp.]
MMRRFVRFLAVMLVVALAAPVDAQLPAPAPSPAPSAALLKFTGQLLDVRAGYAYFTTGDAFAVDPAARITDYASGEVTTLSPSVKTYAVATLDPASGHIVGLALSKKRLAPSAEYAAAKAYVVAASQTTAAAELAPRPGERPPTGRPVAVTFFVQVPPATPLSDSVYITSDATGWVPNAMKMDRVDALHYRLTRTYASGTKFAYRYTRGSFNSVERGEDGLEGNPRQFFAREVDARRVDDIVYHWSDERGNAPNAGPQSIPTPFDPNPFNGLPTKIKQPPRSTPTPR